MDPRVAELDVSFRLETLKNCGYLKSSGSSLLLLPFQLDMVRTYL